MSLETEIWKYFATQGPFAALFVWLLYYNMKANRERENRLQDLLDKFSEKYDVIVLEIRELRKDVNENGRKSA